MHGRFEEPRVVENAEVEVLGAEVNRILEAADGLSLRLTGSIAVQVRCPKLGHLARRDRRFHDIDFAAYRQDATPIQGVLTDLGYVEDREVTVFSDGTRAIFEQPESRLHIDVFYDRLDFCHLIPLEGRLETDGPTLPLVELLLGKLQIVKINKKDLVDAAVLLLEHPLEDVDAGAINLAHMVRLASEEWGLWRTVMMNLDKIEALASEPGWLSVEQQARVVAQASAIRDRMESAPKSLTWRMRARLGDRVKWYKDVEDVR